METNGYTIKEQFISFYEAMLTQQKISQKIDIIQHDFIDVYGANMRLQDVLTLLREQELLYNKRIHEFFN